MCRNSHNLVPLAGNIPSMIPGPLAAHVHPRSSHPPFTANNFGPSTSAQSNNTLFSTGMQDNTSFLTSELCTPAAKEGSRAEAKTPTSTPVNHRGQSAVVLTPATCKHLQDIAARLWVIAHNQQYEPQSMSDFDQKRGAMPQLGQVLLADTLTILLQYLAVH